jgi:hypothetical protein
VFVVLSSNCEEWAIWQQILKESTHQQEQERKRKLAEARIEQQIQALKEQKKNIRFGGEGLVLGFMPPAKRLKNNDERPVPVVTQGPTIESLSEDDWNFQLEENIDLGFDYEYEDRLEAGP